MLQVLLNNLDVSSDYIDALRSLIQADMSAAVDANDPQSKPKLEVCALLVGGNGGAML